MMLYTAETLAEARQMAILNHWTLGLDEHGVQLDGWEVKRRRIKSALSKRTEGRECKFDPYRNEQGQIVYFDPRFPDWDAAWDLAYDLSLWDHYLKAKEGEYLKKMQKLDNDTEAYLQSRLAIWESGKCLWGDIKGEFICYTT